MVKVHESNEPTQLALGLGLREVPNVLNFLRQGSDTLLVDVMSQEIQLLDAEETLVGVDDNAMSSESFKNGL